MQGIKSGIHDNLIKKEAEYTRALNRIETLMDAKAGTTEADELEFLTALIEMYEEQHYPMDMPDSVDAITLRMDQLGFSRT